MSKFLIYSDGGARGNPGEAGYGFLIKFQISNSKLQINSNNQNPKFKTIVKEGKFIGIATNNQAEYQGILAALKHLKSQIPNPKLQTNPNDQNSNDQKIEIVCRLDSQLIVEQMNGRYKVKNEGLKPLYWEIRNLVMELGGRVRFEYIPREKNKEADKLVNEAIDKEFKKKE